MDNFKAGDRVVAVDNGRDYETKGIFDYAKGDKGIVIDGSLNILFDNGKSIEGCDGDNFKLLEDDNMGFSKADLKTGHVVELRDGKRYLVFRDIPHKFYNNDDLLIKLDSGQNRSLECYEDNLLRNDRDNEVDIMKVFESDYIGNILRIIGNNNGDDLKLTLVWQRESEQMVQIKSVIADLKDKLREAEDKLKRII